MHDTNNPFILDLGTPVALLGTLNDDLSLYLAAVTSVWWAGPRCIVGLSDASRTSDNLRRTREIVVNMPSSGQADAIERLLRVVGRTPVREHELDRGYRCGTDGIGILGLTPVPSATVHPPRVLECPIQLEAVLDGEHGQGRDSPLVDDVRMFEVRVTQAHLDRSILMDGDRYQVDPGKWRPLTMNFR